MKKMYWWIMALMMALALLVTGCSTGGEDPEDPDNPNNGDETEPVLLDITAAFPATVKDQPAGTVVVTANTATISFSGDEMAGELQTGEGVVFDASVYSGIKFEYKATANLTFFIQDEQDIYIFATVGDGWAAIPGVDEWTELELPFSIAADQNWVTPGSVLLDTSKIIKLFVRISTGAYDKKFEMRNLYGIPKAGAGEKPPEEEEPGDGTIVEATGWYLADGENGTKIDSNTKTVTAAQETDGSFAGYVHIYFTPESSGFDKIKVTFTSAKEVTKQCVWDAAGTWGKGWETYTSGTEIDPAVDFAQSWSGATGALDKTTMNGICFKMSFASAAETADFTLTKVEMVK